MYRDRDKTIVMKRKFFFGGVVFATFAYACLIGGIYVLITKSLSLYSLALVFTCIFLDLVRCF